MKKSILFILFLLVIQSTAAFTLPKGTFYFDNSITNFKQVKLVYGYEDSRSSFIKSLTYDGNNRWYIQIDEAVNGLYRYTFAETALKDGHYAQTFPQMKNGISDRGEVRTATTDKTMIPGYVFVPEDNDHHNWYQGNWEMPSNCFPHSNTVPVVYLRTDGGKPIESKDFYLPGNLYIDALSNPGYSSLGTSITPIPLRVKGRGNYTWKDFDKKPYRIKFNLKQKVLNMPSDKSWAFLAHADDDLAFLRNTVGFALSRYFGLAYTPRQEPVELFLNNQYQGLYMLTEHIKVDKDRVHITEQRNGETDPVRKTGGWLLEIDNYQDENQFEFWENEESWPVWVTYKSPDSLSVHQFNYMQDFLETTNRAIYNQKYRPTEWENYIDIDTLVNFYLIQEIMNNRESFHGSCYMHKERGTNTKLIFGPVWDFGNSYRNTNEEFIYENPPYGDVWIDEIAKSSRFQQKIRQRWAEKRGNLMPYIRREVNQFIDKIAEASYCDCRKWPDYGTPSAYQDKEEFLHLIEDRLHWLDSHWGTVDVEEMSTFSIQAYPNPTRGLLHLDGLSQIQSIALMDLSGQTLQWYSASEVANLTAPSGEVVLSLHQEPGTYLLYVQTTQESTTLKIVVY